MRNRWLATALVLAGLGAVAFSLQEPSYLMAAEAAIAPGKPAPAFEARLVSGSTIKFPEQYKGKVVLVDFWATWCFPCRLEVPHIVEAHGALPKEHFAILSISLDKNRNRSLDAVKDYAAKSKMDWDHVYDGAAEISIEYQVEGIPAPFLIDGDTGKILAMGEALRGEGLLKKLEREVARKKQSKEK
jgi:thiol-disulfide isomerase/thioredoxin